MFKDVTCNSKRATDTVPGKEKGGWVVPIPLPVRVVIAAGLPAERDPEAHAAAGDAHGVQQPASGHRRVSKAGTLRMQASVVKERINRREVRVVEYV